MNWSNEYERHRCNFPSDTLPQDLRTYWTCDECKTVFRVSITAWTGWWTPDTSESVSGTNKYGTSAIYCMYEKWVTCTPSIQFSVEAKGILDTGFSAHSMEYPHIEKPEYIVKREREPRRPLWAGKEIPGAIKEGPAGGLSRLAVPGDADLPEPTPPKKRRKWLMNG